MFYQRILTVSSPYAAWIRDASTSYPEHRHADIELHYCTEGSFRITLDKREHTVHKGELLLIPPMVSHELPSQEESDGRVLTAVLGFSFLREDFAAFSAPRNSYPILSSASCAADGGELFALLEETADACWRREPAVELLIRGNLYKIFYYLSSYPTLPQERGRTRSAPLKNIDRALDLIHREYRSPLSVEKAAAVTGYSISNFCKVFREITGDTFHNALNKYRTEIAAELLVESELSVSEISETVGFSEQKTFCRVFKALKGLSPSTFRRLTAKNGT